MLERRLSGNRRSGASEKREKINSAKEENQLVWRQRSRGALLTSGSQTWTLQLCPSGCRHDTRLNYAPLWVAVVVVVEVELKSSAEWCEERRGEEEGGVWRWKVEAEMGMAEVGGWIDRWMEDSMWKKTTGREACANSQFSAAGLCDNQPLQASSPAEVLYVPCGTCTCLRWSPRWG